MPDEEFYDTYPDYVREKANIIEIELQTVDVTSV